MLTGFFWLLFLAEGVHPQNNCSYQEVLDHLKITKSNELYYMTRPVKNYKRPTLVSLEVLLYAILDVVEKEQKFIPYVWTVIRWHNEHISWDPKHFCGINNLSLPAEILWKPDLTIEEMTEKDKAPPSPYLTINNMGYVEIQNDQVLVSTCRMHIYKFPFDAQSCNLSFKSVIHTAKDIRLLASDNSSEATEWSRELMRTQYEWLFINMIVTTENATDLEGQDVIVYTVRRAGWLQVNIRRSELSRDIRPFQITMKRRPLLYIVNFLLPVLFFLCLDLSSFLISDKGGEKLSFKVTVLLAVTVLQLILNEILPSSSNRIPLIAVYCIGNFALMLLSLLETILVMHLLERDNSPPSVSNRDQTLGDEKEGHSIFPNFQGGVTNWSQCLPDMSAGETMSELLPVARQGDSSSLRGDCPDLEKLSDELRELEKTLSQLLSSSREEKPGGYWADLAKKVNRIFFIFYLTTVVVFLAVIYTKWNETDSW
ncbi:5-hydroxytryptamine receptor 3A-like isoform X2 [Takifugu flavidus]|uniref:5-hydroxytryptamine receptor 3A-like isoform X2 n=1 Tax=Takifugu flavidus TaxID=433684 RepID=UPI002544CB8C|nr:5-hydroxytryptamine receptor 3A-like isoform X2 [Takifugu flavidus]